MDTRFEIIERTYYRRDRFDAPLDSYLFDTVKQLRVLTSGEHPIWQDVVKDLLTTYITRFNDLYHFKLARGDQSIGKSKRQIDYEKHIEMLEHTRAREYISKVCIATLRGHGWQTLQGLGKWRWKNLFRPRKLFFWFISLPYRFFIRIIQRIGGAWYALEVLGLFKSLNDEEAEALLDYLQTHSYEWGTLYVVNVLARPRMISKEKQERLTKIIFSKQFERSDVHEQVLARLSQISEPALRKLVGSENESSFFGTYSGDLLEILARSSASNPEAMHYLLEMHYLKDATFASTVEDKLRKNLGIVDKESLRIVLDKVEVDHQLDVSELILRNISQISASAKGLVYDYLTSSDLRKRYLAAYLISNLSNSEYSDIRNAYEVLEETGLGPDYLEATNESYQSRDQFQQRVIRLLLVLAKDYQHLAGRFLNNLRARWEPVFVETVRYVFLENLSDEETKLFAHHLISGEIADCKVILERNINKIGQQFYDEVLQALETVETSNMLGYILYKDGTIPQIEFSKVCLGYEFRIWHCLVDINSSISSIISGNRFVIPALLCLQRPNRTERHAAPLHSHDKDSYVSICSDISKAIELINLSDEDDELLVEKLESWCTPSSNNINTIMRAISCFPRLNTRLLNMIRIGIEDRHTRKEAYKVLTNLPRLDRDAEKMIIQGILDRSMSSDILENPQSADSSGVDELIAVLKNRKELTKNDDITELWVFIYTIKSLVNSSAIGEDAISICKEILLEKTSLFDERRAKGERPFAVWALSRVRPINSEIIDILKKIVNSGPPQLISTDHIIWTKVAAIIALSEIGSDITNGLTWDERESFADMIIKYVKIPFPSDYHLFGGENVFPERPSDAVYDAATLIVETMRKHWAQTDYVVEDDID
jgi:hypothetical protein